MPQPLTKNNEGVQFLPVRKDQRFPPRYKSQQKPVLKGNGINALQFIKKVAKTQLMNSRYVKLVSVQRNKNKPLIKFTTITQEPNQKPRKHVQRIYAADQNYKGPLYLCPRLKVTCDCGNNLFQWEVANAYRGASDIIYSNGDYPIDTNPSLRPGCCKHLLKCLMFMVLNRL